MTKPSPRWFTKVPAELPELRMFIMATGVDLRTLADRVDLQPLVELTPDVSMRQDLSAEQRYFIDPGHFENFRHGRNCWTGSLITLGVDHIELWDQLGDDACFAAGDQLITYLRTHAIAFEWHAFSYYSDGNQASAVQSGTAADFALLSS